MASEKKTRKKKDMTITLKSKPLAGDSTKADQIASKAVAKPRQKQRKGTRGPAWIG